MATDHINGLPGIEDSPQELPLGYLPRGLLVVDLAVAEGLSSDEREELWVDEVPPTLPGVLVRRVRNELPPYELPDAGRVRVEGIDRVLYAHVEDVVLVPVRVAQVVKLEPEVRNLLVVGGPDLEVPVAGDVHQSVDPSRIGDDVIEHLVARLDL